MENLEKLLRRETSYMFTDVFYGKLTKAVLDFISENKHKGGYIYFIKNGSSGNKVKIGSAIDIDRRVNSYQTAFHEKIFIVGYIKSDDYIFLEKEIHSIYSDSRVKGEWFEINDIDLFSLREMYEFKSVNDYYKNGVLIEKMESKEPKNKFNEITEFCKKLEKGKEYRTSNLFKKFKKENPNIEITNSSWFGRELSNSFRVLGLKKKDSTAGGVRTFKII